MRLVPNWRRVLRHAWSIRFNLAALVFAAAEIILPLYQDVIPRGVFAVGKMPYAANEARTLSR